MSNDQKGCQREKRSIPRRRGELNGLFEVGCLDSHLSEFEVVPNVHDVDSKSAIRHGVAKVITFLLQREMNDPHFLDAKVLAVLTSSPREWNENEGK